MKTLPAQNTGLRVSHARQPSSGIWAAIEQEFRRALSFTPLAIFVAAVRGDGLPSADAARSREGCNIH
ncbi:hypothetical protein SNE35_02275 [Paucibacter sp. R3-3]|uniref:Uncharacterized protein n=1 Tax=Roseateles agri TaxID=3098619 RepID=A0ABU5DC23_9BURK|nr:hypothetical protein [Paucibacter sp. R3-3]MDY0743310.1 hypothetical protein [Paucibacter sp. R3-3]